MNDDDFNTPFTKFEHLFSCSPNKECLNLILTLTGRKRINDGDAERLFTSEHGVDYTAVYQKHFCFAFEKRFWYNKRARRSWNMFWKCFWNVSKTFLVRFCFRNILGKCF